MAVIDKSIFSTDRPVVWNSERDRATNTPSNFYAEIPGNVRTCVNKESRTNFEQHATLLLLPPRPPPSFRHSG